MATWQLQEAKARFSELVNAALKRGPQVISRRGIPTAVLVPMHQWTKMQEHTRPTLKELLLADEPRFDGELAPPRGRLRHRPVPDLS